MLKNIARALKTGAAFSALALIVATVPAWGQLSDVAWNEAISLGSNLGQDSHTGANSALPEPQNGTLSGTGYAMHGSITFASPSAPNTIASIDANYQSGLIFLGGLAYSRIDFDFRVVQTATPPIAVTTVPVNIHAQGTADASGSASLFPSAISSFNLSTPAGPLVSWVASTGSHAAGPQISDSFNNTQKFDFAPDVVVSGDMTADASISAELLQNGTSASASAMVDPSIAVADEVIPGTAVNYRDYFAVEFAPGYDALGAVPTRDATWGMIKKLYGN